ncbi:MAG: hypothetical protein F4Y31_06845 [Gammaproteobacteria bacterium]|nr:hypothetical protein [Gammaproteobacteria bacterium]MYF66338.1 hypothetical protein [Gammaproteobacteria bacterium]MYK38355.1 hypothetical protein [Gammaproteobacteria bacterium]
MNPFETATKFFHACESLEGWEGCRQYVADNAQFAAQSEPLVDVTTVEDYCEWMAGLGRGPLEGCSYDLKASSYDESTRTAMFFATFHGTHVGEGGPVPATRKSTRSHYVYVISLDETGKVSGMTKIWNAPWALKELGWA